MTEVFDLHGVQIPNDPAFITNQIARAISKGRYEKQEVTTTPRFITAEDRVLELGAGLGFISTYVAKTLGVSQITCVEADPKLCGFIERVHAMNGIKGAQVRNCVATGQGERGTMPFYVRDPFWSSSLDPEPDYVSMEDVPVVPLGELIAESSANTLIVDIEGGERDLFQGADLTGVNKIFLELHTRKIRRMGIKLCFDALSAQDFCYDQQVSNGGAVLFQRIPQRQLRAYAAGG